MPLCLSSLSQSLSLSLSPLSSLPLKMIIKRFVLILYEVLLHLSWTFLSLSLIPSTFGDGSQALTHPRRPQSLSLLSSLLFYSLSLSLSTFNFLTFSQAVRLLTVFLLKLNQILLKSNWEEFVGQKSFKMSFVPPPNPRDDFYSKVCFVCTEIAKSDQATIFLNFFFAPDKKARAFFQGILKGEVSLYHWPPVWLVWISLFCK